MGIMLFGAANAAEIACTDLTASYEIAAGDVYVITVANKTTAELTGVITGAGSVKKKNNGVLVIRSANAYTGGTYVDGGTVEACTTTAFGMGPITVKGLTGSTYNANAYCGIRFSTAGAFANDITIEHGYDVPATLDKIGGTPTYYKTPQIDFGVSGKNQTVELSGTITGPSDGMTWIVDQSVKAAGGTGFTAILSGVVNVPYCYCSPIYDMKFTGKTTATWMHFNRTNGSNGYKNTGCVYLGGTENRIGRISYGYNGLRCLNANAFGDAILSADFTVSESSRTYLGLCGFDQTVAGLATTMPRSDVNPAAGYAVVNSDGSPNWNSAVKSATLTVEPQDKTVEWSAARFYGPLTVVFKAKAGDITHEFYNRCHEITGSVIVSNGIFRLTGAASMPALRAISAIGSDSHFDCQTTTNIAYFAAVRTLTATEGGEIHFPAANSTDPFAGAGVKLIMDSSSAVTLPPDFQLRVTEFWYDGVRRNGGYYTQADIPGLSGTIVVDPYVDGPTIPVTWTGGAGPGDTSVTNDANWLGNKAPNLSHFDCDLTVVGGTGMTVPPNGGFNGITFAIPAEDVSFTVSATDPIVLGTGGLKTAYEPTDESVRIFTLSAPVILGGAQSWNVNGLGTTLEVKETVSSTGDHRFERFGTGIVNFRAENTFTGTFYLTNGVTHVYSPTNGLGAYGARVEVGAMSNGICQVVFHNANESRDFAFCHQEATTQERPALVFFAGTTNVLSGVYQRTLAPWKSMPRESVCMKAETNAVARFTGKFNNLECASIFCGPGEFWSTGAFMSSSQVYLFDACHYHLGNVGCYPHSFEIRGAIGSQLYLENAWAFNASCKMAGGVSLGDSANGRLHLQGYDQRINFLANAGYGVIETPEGCPATVWIDFSRTDNRPQNMHATVFHGTVRGPVSFVSVGTNFTADVKGELGAKGSLTVCTNVFALGASTTWTNCTGIAVKDRGVLSPSCKETCFDRHLPWSVSGEGVICLPPDATYRAGSLTVDGVEMPLGLYSNESCPAVLPAGVTVEQVKSHFAAGGGSLRVIGPKAGLVMIVK